MMQYVQNRFFRHFISLLFGTLILSYTLSAQSTTEPLTNSVNLLFGLNQPLIGGFNVEGNVFYKRLAFDYSHGISLNLNEGLVSEEEARQGLVVHIPYTTGFGLGYRFNNWLNLRVEPKWHRFELYYAEDEQVEANQINAYNTFTLGLGLYANLRPFKNQPNALKGIMVAPSVRWWPNVSNNLSNDQFSYENRNTGQTEIHEARNVGLANTPWILNVSIGYAFDWQ